MKLSTEVESSFDALSSAVELAMKQTRILRLALQMMSNELAKYISNPGDLQKVVPEYWIMEAQREIDKEEGNG